MGLSVYQSEKLKVKKKEKATHSLYSPLKLHSVFTLHTHYSPGVKTLNVLYKQDLLKKHHVTIMKLSPLKEMPLNKYDRKANRCCHKLWKNLLIEFREH